jgi:hypothetical protein
MVLVFYTFFFGSSSPFYSAADGASRLTRHPSAHAPNPRYAAAAWGGEGLKNRVFFTFMFVEMIAWFWVWVTLREERTRSRRARPCAAAVVSGAPATKRGRAVRVAMERL